MPGIPDAICWHEGMPLLPQHFQLQALHADAMSARHARGTHPWFWGVNQLKVDPSQLAKGLVRITELQAVMPDGLVVDLDRERDKDPVLQLQLSAQDCLDRSELMIYLAIAPLWRAGQLVPWGERLRSWQADAIPDLESGKFPRAVSVLRPRMRLVTAAGLGDAIGLPLLRLSCEDLSFARLPYHPPSPQLASDAQISLEIAELCTLARQKAEFLAARLRRAQEDGKSSESAELRLQLSAIWAALPSVQAALDSGIAHPASLYFQLVGMTGPLASLDPEQGVTPFKPLRYESLLENFQEVLSWLTAKLSNIRMGYSRRIFQCQDRRFFIELLDKESPEQLLVIGLRMPAGSPAQAAQEWLEQAVIGSQSQLVTLVRQRMRGLRFKALERSEQIAYSVGEAIRLFSVQARGEWFQAPERLFVFVPGSETTLTAPSEIVLFDASTQD